MQVGEMRGTTGRSQVVHEKCHKGCHSQQRCCDPSNGGTRAAWPVVKVLAVLVPGLPREMGQRFVAVLVATALILGQSADALVCPHQGAASDFPTLLVVVMVVVTLAEIALELVYAFLLGAKVLEVMARVHTVDGGQQRHSSGQQQQAPRQDADGSLHGATAFATMLAGRLASR